MHYYKFNIADWYLSTSHLSLIEEAVYFRLINHYYDTEGFIPLETQSVIRRLRMETHEETVLAILGEFFTLTEKGFIHKRCEGMLKEYRKTKNKNRINGSKGGRPRKGEASSVSQNKPTGNPDVSQVEPKHNLNQEPLTTNHKPINIHFERFWNAGLVKKDKKTSLSRFKTAIKGNNVEEFTTMLCEDIKKRLSADQFGFDKLNPATYLNNQRWEDEAPKQNSQTGINEPPRRPNLLEAMQ